MDEKGSALLEFSLVLPLLFFCIWGVLAFLNHAMENQILHFGAYSIARSAMVGTPSDAENRVRLFLATARKEPLWASASTDKLTGGKISVSKTGGHVSVEISRGLGAWGKWMERIYKSAPIFVDQNVYYAMGRLK